MEIKPKDVEGQGQCLYPIIEQAFDLVLGIAASDAPPAYWGVVYIFKTFKIPLLRDGVYEIFCVYLQCDKLFYSKKFVIILKSFV